MLTKSILGGLAAAGVLLGSLALAPQPAEAGKGFCPPGLRDKGCVPPGQQKFHHGDYIPPHVHYDYFDWRGHRLPHPKHGHRYSRLGEDVYLSAEATQRVIEAINLLDAASH